MYNCSFCGKDPTDVICILQGPQSVNICNECLEVGNLQVHQYIERKEREDAQLRETSVQGSELQTSKEPVLAPGPSVESMG